MGLEFLGMYFQKHGLFFYWNKKKFWFCLIYLIGYLYKTEMWMCSLFFLFVTQFSFLN